MAADYLSIESPLGSAITLRGFTGEERISRPFCFELELATSERTLDVRALLGQPASIRMGLGTDGESRYLSGIITRVAHTGSDGPLQLFSAELRPWLWLLSLSSDYRSFQGLSVPQIFDSVCGELGQKDFSSTLRGLYEARELCVQYGESTLNFVSRLLEDEGIFYFFTHRAGAHTLMLSDDLDEHPPCPFLQAVPFSQHADRDPITAIVSAEQLVSTAYALDDYSFMIPNTDLFVRTGQSGAAWREYPGGYEKKAHGEKRARLRIESREQHAQIISGHSLCRGLISGHRFRLSEHTQRDLNQEYVVRAVRHHATQHGYRNTFEAQPATLPFRPELETPKPRIAGAQTAVVVGQPGEEIWTDRHGRVRLRFHWDGSEQLATTAWVRVMQPWAGKGFGTLFLPRVGQEVVVTFLDGDPDRPLITGAVYNVQQSIPWELPQNQTCTAMRTRSSRGGGGFNELCFDDRAGAEELSLRAERDFKQIVRNDSSVEIGHDESKKVKGSRRLKISEDSEMSVRGNRSTDVLAGDESLRVKRGGRRIKIDRGDETHSVGGRRSLHIKKEEEHRNDDTFTQNVKKDFTLRVKGNLTFEVDGDVRISSKRALTLTGEQGMELDSGQDLLSKARMNLRSEAKLALENKAGTTLSSEAAVIKHKAQASQECEGGGLLVLKGGLVRIN